MNHKLLTKKRTKRRKQRLQELKSKQYQEKLLLKDILLTATKTRLRS